MITEPRWRSFIVETTQPIFTPEQCKMIIEAGRAEPKQDASVGAGDQAVSYTHLTLPTIYSVYCASSVICIPSKPK